MTQTPQTLLLLGGTSDIGRATARVFAGAGWRIILAARNVGEAQLIGDEIEAAGGSITAALELDILHPETFPAFVDGLPSLPHAVVCVIGLLGDQFRAQSDQQHASTIMRTNFEGPAILIDLIAKRFEARKSGVIIGVGSVAGDRGRASNYVYGAAKAGFSAYLSGLRNRLARSGVRVVTVKPGFVRTRMTEGLKLPRLLTAETAEVARAIHRAAEGGRSDVIYVRWIWGPLMAIIRALPEPVFKRLRL